jgi:hypothetical protein
MRIHFGLTLACTLAITSACGGQRPDTAFGPDPRTADSLVFERTACFGFCPVYRLRLSRDGSVALRWQQQTEQRTVIERSWTIAPATVQALLAQAQHGGITALPDDIPASKTYCPQAWTDAPGAVVAFYGTGWSKRITDYFGCQKVPPALRAFEVAVDSAADLKAHAPS